MDKPPTSRFVRVFVSSTFRDMQAERDELAKFIFPQLRRLCEQRGVIWGEVDLRWGITEEQKAEGKVLPICLEEIHRCRPYFIGLLGERYGWIPDEIPGELMEREPWLVEHHEHSVTELEILHGVLNNPTMAEHAFFYFRDPDYIEILPIEQRPGFREEPAQAEIDAYGYEVAIKRAKLRQEKLVALKERIYKSGFPIRKNYRDPKQLGQWVLQDLTQVIESLFPEDSLPDPLDREAAEHEIFAASRTAVYIGRQAYFDRLDAHVEGDSPPLVVLGQSGSGKSALLANWATQYRRKHPNDFLLMHFIGSTSVSADWMAMLRRVMGEFMRHFKLEGDIPDQPSALRAALNNWLYRVGEQGRAVLILDGLNQLEDRHQALDLVWLPTLIPPNIRLILSTLPGRPLDELEKRSWPTLLVESLEPEERRRLIREYLALFTKKLDRERIERIVSVPQTTIPLYLRILLEELRIFGVHEQLDERIDHYLCAATVPALYGRILERYEQDYERDRPKLVMEITSLLWAARRGLSEAELSELLGSDEGPLPRAYLSPLYLAMEPSLVIRSGLIDFSHPYLREAVQQRYLSDEGEPDRVHMRLAEYFDQSASGLRRVDELPWQLARAKSWEGLYDLLCDFSFFGMAYPTHEYEIKAYWAQVEHNSPFRALEGYQNVLQSPEKYLDYVWDVGILMADFGHIHEALLLREVLIEHFRQTGDWGKLAASIGMHANALYARGDLNGALSYHQEEEKICRDLELGGGLAISLVNQAVIHFDRGHLDQAYALYQEAERGFREQGTIQEENVKSVYQRGLAKALTGQANVLRVRGEFEKALGLHAESERISRILGHRDELIVSLTNQANTLAQYGDLARAMALYVESEKISRELGSKQWLAHSLGNQANIHFRRGELNLTESLYDQAESFYRELDDRPGLVTILRNQAQFFSDRGDVEKALHCYTELVSLCRELGDKRNLQSCLSNQAYLQDRLGDTAQALTLQKESESLCRELGDQHALAISLIHQAVMVGLRMGQRQAALPMAEEAYHLALACEDGRLAQQVDSLRREIRYS